MLSSERKLYGVMSKINVLIVQISPKRGKKKRNLNKVKSLIEESNCHNPDLIILPEFFNTGIDNQSFIELAEEEKDSETLAFLSEIAIKYNTNIVGGTIIEKDCDKLYNTSYFLNREGNILGKYRKIHLFNYFGGNEGECITPGTDLVVLDTDIGKVGMSICFDIRFPLMFNKLLKKGAEIIVCPAAWANDWIHTWEICNQSLAMQNAAYFISSTGCGEVGYTMAGNSMIVEPNGRIISRLGREESTLCKQIDLNDVKVLRDAFPIMNLE